MNQKKDLIVNIAKQGKLGGAAAEPASGMSLNTTFLNQVTPSNDSESRHKNLDLMVIDNNLQTQAPKKEYSKSQFASGAADDDELSSSSNKNSQIMTPGTKIKLLVMRTQATSVERDQN